VFARQANFAAHIKWEGSAKIARYRLQLSRDDTFSDIVFDKVVQGHEYTVTELPAGNYFWRVAPAVGETGAYSKPLPVTVESRGPNFSSNVQPTVLTPPADVGWRTATGAIARPMAAKLRAGPNMDVVGVNAYGMVYAVDGANGTALWSARFRPSAKKGEPVNSDSLVTFAPLLIETANGLVNVVAAFDGGIRSLDGATGRELWRASLASDALTGVVLAGERAGQSTVVVFDDSKTLSFLKSDTGQLLSETKLAGVPAGPPVAFKAKNETGVLLGLTDGTLDARNMAGISMLAVRLDAALTTAPFVVRSQGKQLVMIGTESGLVALDAADLTPLWRVATEGDAPQGMLAAGDVDADGRDDVMMITRRGRLVAVNVANGKIKWYAEGVKDALQAAFADLNGDGAMDVLVAVGSAQAAGYSGRDGALIWKADEPPSKNAGDAAAQPPRGLLAASLSSDLPPLLVGTDPGRTGLRAVGLPPKSVR
jgi:outer membrane protein assembly factor BamB